MWCYSLRFPRIRRIKMNRSYMDCLTFQELQEMGRLSISTKLQELTTDVTRDQGQEHELFIESKPQKRVRFLLDNLQPDKLLKSDYFVHLSHKIKLSDRDKLIKWFDFRGFELIWSLEAVIKYSDRKVIIISADDCPINDFILIPFGEVENRLQIEGAYFRILDQG